jgi:hypothetical protein
MASWSCTRRRPRTCGTKHAGRDLGSPTLTSPPFFPRHVFNLLSEGDDVRCSTVRKVVKESSTGSSQAEKIRLNLTLHVRKSRRRRRALHFLNRDLTHSAP